jgi:hypothetical protein
MKYQYTDGASISIAIGFTITDIDHMLRWCRELKKPSHPDEFYLGIAIQRLTEAKKEAASSLRLYVNDLEMENEDAF